MRQKHLALVVDDQECSLDHVRPVLRSLGFAFDNAARSPSCDAVKRPRRDPSGRSQCDFSLDYFLFFCCVHALYDSIGKATTPKNASKHIICKTCAMLFKNIKPFGEIIH